jgi:hypothetical protein
MFQLINSIQTESEKADQDDSKRQMDMQTDYCTTKTPIITPSIFIDSLAYDVCYMLPEMQAKIPARVNLLNDDIKQQQAQQKLRELPHMVARQEGPVGTDGRKMSEKSKEKIMDNFDSESKQSKKNGKKQITDIQIIWNEILKHILNNMREVENA